MKRATLTFLGFSHKREQYLGFRELLITWKSSIFMHKKSFFSAGKVLTSKEVVDAVIARMSWPDHLNQKFRSIPCPPDGAKLANWDLQDALDWLARI
jgi:hypothetical protein